MGEMNMTMYDFNKAVYQNMPPLEPNEFTEDMVSISLWFSSKEKTKHFMLLCRELNDYTIFEFDTYNYDDARNKLSALIASRGKPMDIDYNHDTDTYDIWVQKNGEIYMYKLFDCEDFFVYV